MVSLHDEVRGHYTNMEWSNDEITTETVYDSANQMFEVNRLIPTLGIYQLW